MSSISVVVYKSAETRRFVITPTAIVVHHILLAVYDDHDAWLRGGFVFRPSGGVQTHRQSIVRAAGSFVSIYHTTHSFT